MIYQAFQLISFKSKHIRRLVMHRRTLISALPKPWDVDAGRQEIDHCSRVKLLH